VENAPVCALAPDVIEDHATAKPLAAVDTKLVPLPTRTLPEAAAPPIVKPVVALNTEAVAVLVTVIPVALEKVRLPENVAEPLNVPVPKPAPAPKVGVPEKFAAPEMVVGVIVPNVCVPVQVLAWPRAKEATTAPVVGLMVSVPSEFETELTAPPPATAVVTKAVVAICVVFVPAVAVGAKGTPVNVGETDNTAFPPVPVDAPAGGVKAVGENDQEPEPPAKTIAALSISI